MKNELNKAVDKIYESFKKMETDHHKTVARDNLREVFSQDLNYLKQEVLKLSGAGEESRRQFESIRKDICNVIKNTGNQFNVVQKNFDKIELNFNMLVEELSSKSDQEIKFVEAVGMMADKIKLLEARVAKLESREHFHARKAH